MKKEYKYILSCGSTCDLDNVALKEYGIEYIPYHFFLDNKEYLDDLGNSLSLNDFYRAMREGKNTKTSSISVGEYVEYFSKFIDSNKEVLHCVFSSGLSSSFSNALLAKEIIIKDHPNFKLYIVDSLAASSGYGLLMIKLAKLRDEGKSIEELYDFVINNRLKVNHWFFSTDLTWYIKGGRVSKTSGMVGNMLHICPLLNVNNEGKLIAREKILGEKKSILNILKKMEANAVNGLDYSDLCFISHSDYLDVAKTLKSLIEEKFKNLKNKVEIYNIGPTIGSHSGPGTLALFFFGKERKN